MHVQEEYEIEEVGKDEGGNFGNDSDKGEAGDRLKLLPAPSHSLLHSPCCAEGAP